MAEGGESLSQIKIEDISEKLEKAANDANVLNDQFSNVCLEIKVTDNTFTDATRRDVLNKTEKIIKASDAMLKNAKDVHEFVSNTDESGQENIKRLESGRSHPRSHPPERDSGIGRSVDSSVLQEENSVVTNPVEDREECNYPIQDTSGPNE